jgi:DNA-directed RNA polymerase subunit RPC12/RpoP
MNCPGCHAAMLSLSFDRALLPSRISANFCFACQLAWFDQHDCAQLSPGGVLEVFKALNEHRSDARNPLPELLDCPRCSSRLALTQDLQHTTHFSYYRCRFGHGRLSSFLQFMLEKNFIRPVSGEELAALKAKVRTIQCSNCGAPVDLRHSIACAYCHTPISILDPDAVTKAVGALAAAEANRKSVNVDALADAIMLQQQPDTSSQISGTSLAVDLVAVGVGIFAALLR